MLTGLPAELWIKEMSSVQNMTGYLSIIKPWLYSLPKSWQPQRRDKDGNEGIQGMGHQLSNNLLRY